MSKRVLGVLFAVVTLALVPTAKADGIAIQNASFEASNPLTTPCGAGCAYNWGPVPGWNVVNGGSWEPGASFSSIPDGSLIGFTGASGQTPGVLSQTLTGNSVLANSVYTLTVFVGNRPDGVSGTYTLSLDTILNGIVTTLCSVSGNSASIPAGTFQSEGCTYTSQSTVPAGDLYLEFDALNRQLDVDNVSLTVTNVPEPSSVLLLGIGIVAAILALKNAKKNSAAAAA